MSYRELAEEKGVVWLVLCPNGISILRRADVHPSQGEDGVNLGD